MRSYELRANHGFEGTLPVGDLQNFTSQWGELPKRLQERVPSKPGVYAVVTPPRYTFCLRQEGVHRGKLNLDPTDEDKCRWVCDTDIIYIGKAGGPAIKQTLPGRITQLIRHGLGYCTIRPDGKTKGPHKGGERIWLLEKDDTFLLYWKDYGNPLQMEGQLLKEFKKQHGKWPFGNHRK